MPKLKKNKMTDQACQDVAKSLYQKGLSEISAAKDSSDNNAIALLAYMTMTHKLEQKEARDIVKKTLKGENGIKLINQLSLKDHEDILEGVNRKRITQQLLALMQSNEKLQQAVNKKMARLINDNFSKENPDHNFHAGLDLDEAYSTVSERHLEQTQNDTNDAHSSISATLLQSHFGTHELTDGPITTRITYSKSTQASDVPQVHLGNYHIEHKGLDCLATPEQENNVQKKERETQLEEAWLAVNGLPERALYQQQADFEKVMEKMQRAAGAEAEAEAEADYATKFFDNLTDSERELVDAKYKELDKLRTDVQAILKKQSVIDTLNQLNELEQGYKPSNGITKRQAEHLLESQSAGISDSERTTLQQLSNLGYLVTRGGAWHCFAENRQETTDQEKFHFLKNWGFTPKNLEFEQQLSTLAQAKNGTMKTLMATKALLNCPNFVLRAPNAVARERADSIESVGSVGIAASINGNGTITLFDQLSEQITDLKDTTPLNPDQRIQLEAMTALKESLAAVPAEERENFLRKFNSTPIQRQKLQLQLQLQDLEQEKSKLQDSIADINDQIENGGPLELAFKAELADVQKKLTELEQKQARVRQGLAELPTASLDDELAGEAIRKTLAETALQTMQDHMGISTHAPWQAEAAAYDKHASFQAHIKRPGGAIPPAQMSKDVLDQVIEKDLEMLVVAASSKEKAQTFEPQLNDAMCKKILQLLRKTNPQADAGPIKSDFRDHLADMLFVNLPDPDDEGNWVEKNTTEQNDAKQSAGAWAQAGTKQEFLKQALERATGKDNASLGDSLFTRTVEALSAIAACSDAAIKPDADAFLDKLYQKEYKDDTTAFNNSMATDSTEADADAGAGALAKPELLSKLSANMSDLIQIQLKQQELIDEVSKRIQQAEKANQPENPEDKAFLEMKQREQSHCEKMLNAHRKLYRKYNQQWEKKAVKQYVEQRMNKIQSKLQSMPGNQHGTHLSKNTSGQWVVSTAKHRTTTPRSKVTLRAQAKDEAQKTNEDSSVLIEPNQTHGPGMGGP